jgi:hypothetical protein
VHERPTDSFDAFWRELCRCSGADYDAIPWGESFVDQHRIKVSYNGGLVVVRSGLGILSRWRSFFFSCIRQGLHPYPDPARFRAGVGGSAPLQRLVVWILNAKSSKIDSTPPQRR